MKVFSVNNNKNVEKIEQKKKDIILKVKINNFDLDMQMDTSSEVMLIPKLSGNALKSQFYERAVYNSTNLIGWL